MIPSPEYQVLQAIRKPDRSRAGDMWLCRRLGIVRVFNGHKRGSRHGTVHNNFSLYHCGKPSLYSHPCDWRDDDPNAGVSDPALGGRHGAGEKWEYLGNIFQMLPFEALAGETWRSEIR